MKNFLLATVSALLMTSAFDLHWLFAFVCLIPLLVIHNQELPTWKHILLGSYTGVLFALLNMRWHWGISLSHMGIDTAWPFIFVIWLISGLCGAWVGLWSYMVTKTQNGVFLAFGWGISEVIRAWFIALLWYAPGAMLGTHWTVGFLGYSLAESPLVALASLYGGVVTLGVFIALVNILIYKSFKRKPGLKTDYAFHLVMLITVVGLFTYHFQTKPDVKEPLSISIDIREEADLIILPENASWFSGEWPEYKDSLIIDSSNGKFRFIYTADKLALDGNKFLLMPHGEYQPILTKPIVKLLGAEDKIPDREITPKSSLQYVKGVSVLATACSDVLSYSLFRGLDVDVITNSASHSWFEKSGLLEKHAQQWARVRAVESNAWYYQSTNYGKSFKVSPKGELIYL